MGTVMAPSLVPDASPVINQSSPKSARGKPRTKANAIPASSRSTTTGATNPSTRPSHAPSAPQAASTSITPISTSLASQTAGSTSIGALETSSAMINANVKPILQPAPAPQQVQAQPNSHSQQPQRQASGPPPTAHQVQHPRPTSIVHQQHQHHPGSPAQPHPQVQFGGNPQVPEGNIGIPQQHFVQSQPAGNDPQHPGQAIPYLHGPYGQPAGPFPVTEDGRAMMATALRQYPNIYNNQQPQSPASVSSPHSHDVSNRQFLSQAHPQMAPAMYNNYPQYQSLSHVQPPSYSHHSQSQAPQGLPSQPLLMSHQQSPQQISQQHSRSPTGVNQSPRQKLEPSAMPMHRPIDTSVAMHRPPQVMNGSAQAAPPGSAGSIQQSPRSGGGNNSSAAPGPIPASTPRVIREDADGTLWIEFEYSKDRVKMDYSIKCNVDLVNLQELTEEFKVNNCVYPRAMKPKEDYSGNRYNYETECNNVGWALAKMNETLQGKRGLIQRAVDSWRNSSQDSKLRSRRVRRQQKMAKRKDTAVTGAHGPVVPGTPISAQRPTSMHGSLDMTGAQAYHPAPVGSTAGVVGGNEDVTGAGTVRLPQHHYSTLPNYTPNSATGTGTSMPPPASDSSDTMSPHRFSHAGAIGATSHRQNPSMSSTLGFNNMSVSDSFGGTYSTGVGEKRKRSLDDGQHKRELYGDVRDNKRPKFIVVEDSVRASRVRVKVTLDQVKMGDIPDSFRKKLSVYHRAYFPMQMKDRPGERGARAGGRWLEEGEDASPTPAGMGAEKDTDPDEKKAVTGSTMIKISNLNGGEGNEESLGDDKVDIEGRARLLPRGLREVAVAVPRLSRSKWRKENMLNELGYRMSWNQNRVFAGRLLFLQRSLDHYRNKMKSTIMNSGSAAEAVDQVTEGGEATNTTPTVNAHFETRVGKRKWIQNKKKAGREDEDGR